MTDTTWTHSMPPAAPAMGGGPLARLWTARVTAPLHRALDAALRAGELRELDSATLADIGLRRQ